MCTEKVLYLFFQLVKNGGKNLSADFVFLFLFRPAISPPDVLRLSLLASSPACLPHPSCVSLASSHLSLSRPSLLIHVLFCCSMPDCYIMICVPRASVPPCLYLPYLSGSPFVSIVLDCSLVLTIVYLTLPHKLFVSWHSVTNVLQCTCSVLDVRIRVLPHQLRQ